MQNHHLLKKLVNSTSFTFFTFLTCSPAPYWFSICSFFLHHQLFMFFSWDIRSPLPHGHVSLQMEWRGLSRNNIKLFLITPVIFIRYSYSSVKYKESPPAHLLLRSMEETIIIDRTYRRWTEGVRGELIGSGITIRKPKKWEEQRFLSNWSELLVVLAD